jgi:hypothetical protein
MGHCFFDIILYSKRYLPPVEEKGFTTVVEQIEYKIPFMAGFGMPADVDLLPFLGVDLENGSFLVDGGAPSLSVCAKPMTGLAYSYLY